MEVTNRITSLVSSIFYALLGGGNGVLEHTVYDLGISFLVEMI